MGSQWRLDGLSTAELLDLSRASMNVLRGREFDHLDNLSRLDILDEFEHVTRALPGIGHELINQLGRQNAVDELHTTHLWVLLSERLHITSAEAKRRIANAAALGPGTGLGGQPIPAEHAPTGQAQRDGDINPEHADVILKFFKRLPAEVSAADREKAETQLVDLAKQTHPDAVDAAARQIDAHLNPDGAQPDEEERKNQTFFRMRPQGRDKLTRGSFCIDAETRSYVEAYLAKTGAPGVGNPEDEQPIFGAADLGESAGGRGSQSGGGGGAPSPGQQGLFDYFADVAAGPAADASGPAQDSAPSAGWGSSCGSGPAQDPELVGVSGRADPVAPPNSDEIPEAPEGTADSGSTAGSRDTAEPENHTEAAQRDRRTMGQRYHDAIKRLFRAALGSPGLGRHRGLPVTAIITMTLAELESATGNAMTGGGTMVPMREAIRMASHAHHYLLIYDDEGRPLHLGRSRRLASADRRIVLYAGDRGCTFPHCTRPGYWCQTHHMDEWANQGCTDIDRLTFACEEHHALVGPGVHEWATTVGRAGGAFAFRTVWHPPACVDPLRRGRVNHYHFPGEYLLPPEEFPGPPGYVQKRK